MEEKKEQNHTENLKIQGRVGKNQQGLSEEVRLVQRILLVQDLLQRQALQANKSHQEGMK